VGGAARGIAMSFDAIRAIEACYAPVAEETAWLAGLGQAMEQLDQGQGGGFLTYDASDPAHFGMGALVTTGAPTGIADLMREFYRVATPEQIRSLHWTPPPFGSLLRTMGARAPAMLGALRSFLAQPGLEDLFCVHGADPDHRGAIAGFAGPLGWRPAPALKHELTCLSAHLTTAFRLRRVLGGAAGPDSPHTEAVLDPAGRVVDARGAAEAEVSRDSLAEGVKRVERARGRARRTSPEEAVELWRGLVDGTWSLVDHVETGGKRYVLAVRNAPGVRDPRALTDRERDVLGFVVMGRSNKWIGYTLGLAPSTVAEHLQFVQRKLGVRSRTELILGRGA
jgi:DNA-binding CsgD family transcriptional regulator